MTDLTRQSQPLGRRPALLLVDLSRGFTDPDSPLGCACDGVIAANQVLLGAFRARGLPVFFTTVVYDSSDQAPVFRRRLPALNILERGSQWVEIDPRLGPLANETLVEKQYASGFFRTDLLHRLHAAGADSLVVTGLTTSGCVRATAVDGLQHDFPVKVVRDAVGDRNLQAHAANLFDLHAKYADVTGVDELLELLALAESGQ